ncbi:MAG: acyl-ACP--UDP-N-acetylglucosamine O-acyltransferase [Acidobacteria bacterium]|nr:acyl-ACP--UDP-N-acetylglucosamine O-acyltransferase [Acidobacteriota bacterium]
MTTGVRIHPGAYVHPETVLADGVSIGPHVTIEEGVRIGENTVVEAYVQLRGPLEVGRDNRFFPYSSIGSDPQDVSYRGERTRLVIGDRNIFREFMTVNRGSTKVDGVTSIGNDNYFMAYCHIAHDCRIGSHIVCMNGATLAGHVVLDDNAQVSAFSGVHPFCRVGRLAYIGGYSVITQDVLPYCRVAGARPPLFYGLNTVGLRRAGLTRESRQNVKQMFKIIFESDLNTSQAVEKIKAECPDGAEKDTILSFIERASRGIIKKAARQWDNPLE